MHSSSSLKVDTSGVTAFKALGSAINTAWTSSGWTRDYAYSSNQSVAGTNFSWSNITSVPSAAGTTYEVWKMGDSLQSTMPFYVRVDYWNDGSQRFRFTLGNSQTSGVVNGGVDGEKLRSQDAWVSLDHSVSDPGSSGLPFKCLFAGSSSSFRMGLFLDSYGANTYNAACYFAFERSRDVSGTENGSFVTFLAHSAGQGKEQISIGNMVRPVLGFSTWLTPAFPDQSSISHQGDVGLFPILSQFDSIELPLKYTVLTRYVDTPNGLTSFLAQAYGDTQTYMQIVNYTTKSTLGSTASSFSYALAYYGIIIYWN
jgi:hypothetical protein